MFSLAKRNAVIKRLAGRTDNISAAHWSEAIRIIAEQMEAELHASGRRSSETLDMLNASLVTAKKRRIEREAQQDTAPQLVDDLPESETGCGASNPES